MLKSLALVQMMKMKRRNFQMMRLYLTTRMTVKKKKVNAFSIGVIVKHDHLHDIHALDQTWGKSKQAYYDADEGDDLDEMREEETEALKIQKERLAAMDEADFMDEWGTGPGAVSEKKEQNDCIVQWLIHHIG